MKNIKIVTQALCSFTQINRFYHSRETELYSSNPS